MTCRAVRRIGREWPGHSLTVAGMTLRTTQVGPVITRIVTAHMVVIRCRQPAAGAMAAVTLLRSDKVSTRHTSGSSTIVTAVTGADDIAVIHSQDWNPCGIAMAVLTNIRTLDMPCMLTGCRGAIMTTGAVGGDGAMIKIGRHPGRGGVTEIAGVVAGHMTCMLASRSGAVVAAETGAYHLIVIYSKRRYPSGVAMTGLTRIRRLDMACMLTCGSGSVMTGGAVRRDRGMVEVRRCPGRGRMTEIAGIITWNMSGMFACGCNTVMATEAGADDCGMVHSDHRYPGGITVTILTHVR
jgi:hypothetical protein